MLEAARKINAADGAVGRVYFIEYQCAAMEDPDFPEGAFDIVLSSLAFHYVRDFTALATGVSRWLKKGGDFVFSVEHPGMKDEMRRPVMLPASARKK